MAERFSFAKVSYERRRRLLFGALAWFPIAFVLTGVMAALTGPIFGLFTFFISLAFVGPAMRAFAGTRTAHGSEAEVEDGVLRVPAIDLTVKRQDLEQGLESVADGHVVLDLKKGGTLRLDLAGSADAGERLLTALGVGPDQRTARVPLRGQLGCFTIAFTSFFLGLFPASIFGVLASRALMGTPGPSGLSMALTFGLPILFSVLMARRFGSPHVIVGADGLRVRGRLRNPYIPYSEIVRVTGGSWSVHLALRDGTVVTLPTIMVDPDRVKALVARIERARRRASATSAHLADTLARAGRSLAEWHTDLDRVARREASFREAPIEREDVERIVADPNAKPEQRIGAALVLSRIDVDAAKPHIRIAADATAEEDLKAALLAAAEGEMEEAALARLAKKR